MTSDWDLVYHDRGTGAKRNVEVSHAKSQGSLRPLGSLAIDAYPGNRTNKQGTLLVGNTPGAQGTAAVASPLGYDKIWDDAGSGGQQDGSFWRPRAPSGYVSLGDVCVGNYREPSKDLIWCVRSDLVMDSDYNGYSIWNDGGSGAKAFVSLWGINRPGLVTHGTPKLPVHIDTFRADPTPKYQMPPSNLAKALALPCPNEYKPYNPRTPEWTKDNVPDGGQVYCKETQCQITLPYTFFLPAEDRRCLDRIANPFITLNRTAGWYVNDVKRNNTSAPIDEEQVLEKGVTEQKTSEMSQTAGVSVTVEAGMKGVGMSASMNYQFTSGSSTSYTEYKSEKFTKNTSVPAYTATVSLARHVWLTSSRADGSGDLYQINFNANKDLVYIGIDLK